MGKYDPLSRHLRNLDLDVWNASFNEVERVLGFDLPRSAREYYRTQECLDASGLVGRAVVHFKKSRQSYLLGENCADRLEIIEVRRQRMAMQDFPGYKGVRLPMPTLRILVEQAVPGWRTPLQSVGGIYVIADTKTGKLYVGSASGEGGLWARWSTYSMNGHGGNKDLRRLLKKKGARYADHFQLRTASA